MTAEAQLMMKRERGFAWHIPCEWRMPKAAIDIVCKRFRATREDRYKAIRSEREGAQRMASQPERNIDSAVTHGAGARKETDERDNQILRSHSEPISDYGEPARRIR